MTWLSSEHRLTAGLLNWFSKYTEDVQAYDFGETAKRHWISPIAR